MTRRIQHTYTPRGGCREVFECRDDEVLVSGPAGTGKSRACLEKVFTVCLMTPNVRALLLRKTQRSLGSSALVTWRNYVAREALATGYMVYYGGSAQEPPQYRFKNGSTVTIGGLDNATRIMSTEYDIVYVQEATEITLDDLELIRTRLRNWCTTFQQIVMDCNPGPATHWLKARCDTGLCRMIESRHEDNPRLFDEVIADDGSVSYTVTKRGADYIHGILDKLTGVRYARLRKGLWVSAEGIVYEEFDPAIHVLDWQYDENNERIPLPNDWPRYWVIDFGYVNPFVCKWFAVGPDGEAYMYREIYFTGRTVDEHVKQIMECVTRTITQTIHNRIDGNTTREVVEWTEPMPDAIICDHDAENRAQFERLTGMGTVPAIKTVGDGIDMTKQWLKPDPLGYPRMYYMRDSLVERDPVLEAARLPTCTIEEHPSYVWKKDTNGVRLPEPVKEHDHGMDTDRYFIMDRVRGTGRYTVIS